jgi:hypothetical protein
MTLAQQLRIPNAAVQAGARLSSDQRSALGRAFADTRSMLGRRSPRLRVSDQYGWSA